MSEHMDQAPDPHLRHPPRWREADVCDHGHWRGRVEHVGTQEVRYVESIAGVTDCIDGWVALADCWLGRRPAEREVVGSVGDRKRGGDVLG